MRVIRLMRLDLTDCPVTSFYHGSLYCRCNRYDPCVPNLERTEQLHNRPVEVPKKKAVKKAPLTGASGAF